MGGISFGIDTREFKKTQRKLKALERKLGKDKKTPNLWALAEVDKWTKENFKTQGGKVGGWPALSPEYAKKKKRMGKAKILHITGWLRMKWRTFADNRGGTYVSLDTDNKQKVSIKGEKLEYKGGMSYGLAHDQGTKTLPKRQILPTQKQAAPLVIRAYTVWLRRMLRL